MNAKIYAVGGQVRDQFLGLEPKDKDYVVVGSTEQQMLDGGFKRVGNSFPTFLHPETKAEYALARTEKKTARGYCGFTVDFDPSISIEEDLIRRDLTINSIAMNMETGEIVDPYRGQEDIKNKILRHTSDAFGEDPLRILRLARLYARYNHLGFTIHKDTIALVLEMIRRGAIDELVPERVWAETEKALGTQSPEKYFEILLYFGALEKIMPEVAALMGVPQPPEHHPEIDTFIHTMMCVKQASRFKLSKEAIFATLVHDLGKALTPTREWPHHRGHEALGIEPINELCDRLKVPNAYRWMGLKCSEYHLNVHTAFQLNPKTLVNKIIEMGALQNMDRFQELMLACKADAQGRTGFELRAYPQADYLIGAAKALKAIKFENVPTVNPADYIRRIRYSVIKKYRNQFFEDYPDLYLSRG